MGLRHVMMKSQMENNIEHEMESGVCGMGTVCGGLSS